MICIMAAALDIWDPNGLNPYGQEVAAVLASSGFHVRLWVPKRGSLVLPPSLGLTVRAHLASSAERDGRLATMLRRFFGPLLLVCTLSKRPLILVWARGPWECLVFAFASRFRPVCVVYHNPREERDIAGLAGISWRRLLGSAALVLIHDESFRESAEDANRSVSVVTHPPYSAWAAAQGVSPSQRRSGDGRKLTALFLGALRQDKGASELLALVDALDPERWTLRIVGAGALPAGVKDAAESRGLSLDLVVRGTPVPDEMIADALANSDVLLAPYVAATVSGTVMMANTIGLPCVGYPEGGLLGQLSDAGLAAGSSVADLVAALDRWSVSRDETFRSTAVSLRREAERSWAAAVQALSGRR